MRAWHILVVLAAGGAAWLARERLAAVLGPAGGPVICPPGKSRVQDHRTGKVTCEDTDDSPPPPLRQHSELPGGWVQFGAEGREGYHLVPGPPERWERDRVPGPPQSSPAPGAGMRFLDGGPPAVLF